MGRRAEGGSGGEGRGAVQEATSRQSGTGPASAVLCLLARMTLWERGV